MWIRTVSGWKFFSVEYTKQGVSIPKKPIDLKRDYMVVICENQADECNC